MKIFSATILSIFFIVFPCAQPITYPLQRSDSEYISALSWSRDSKQIVSADGDGNSLRLWDVESGTTLWSNNIGFLQDDLETYWIRQIEWSSDRKLIVTGTDNGKIQLWNAATGKLLWNIKAHIGTVTNICISRDAKLLISSSDEGNWKSELKAWNLSDGKLVKNLSTHQRDISAIRFIDNTHFQTGNGFGEVATWSVMDWKKIVSKQFSPCYARTSNRTKVFYDPSFTSLIAQCDKELVLKLLSTGKVFKRITDEIQNKEPLFSKQGGIRFFTDSINSQIFDIDGNRVEEINGQVLNGGVLNNDGSLLASFPSYHANGIEIFDTQTRQRQSWLMGHPGIIKSLAFSPDGTKFSSGSTDRVVRIWDTQSRRILFSLEGHTQTVQDVTFNSAGTTLTSQSESEQIVWNCETGAKIDETKSKQHFEQYRNSYFSPSGKLALVKEPSKPFRLVDASTGKTKKEFAVIDQLDSLAFCPGEKYFLVKPWWKGWQLWNVENGKPIREFDVSYSYYNSVAFHPDGNTFLTGGTGQNIFMFDLNNGQLIWSLFPIDQKDFDVRKVAEERRINSINRKKEDARIADIENERYKNQVYVNFDHYGEMIDPLKLRLAESDQPRKSKIKKSVADADAIWLRLHNDSPLPIQVPTQSMYWGGRKCFFEFSKTRKIYGLCDNREISVWISLEDKDGKPLHYGFDFGSSTTLLPKTSVVFAVPQAILKNGNAIRFGVTFQNLNSKNTIESYGNTIELRFREKDLPR